LIASAFLLGLCGMVLIPPYNFYTAWKSHAIYISFGHGLDIQVLYGAHPIAFWCILLVDVLSTAVWIAFVVLLVKSGQTGRNYWRRRKTRPPTEDGIRQSITER
jgi:hypothetical protein